VICWERAIHKEKNIKSGRRLKEKIKQQTRRKEDRTTQKMHTKNTIQNKKHNTNQKTVDVSNKNHLIHLNYLSETVNV